MLEKILGAKKKNELFWDILGGVLGGVVSIIITYLWQIIFPNENINVSINILFFSFEWIHYETATIIEIAINFLIGFLITYPLIFRIKKYFQKKQS